MTAYTKGYQKAHAFGSGRGWLLFPIGRVYNPRTIAMLLESLLGAPRVTVRGCQHQAPVRGRKRAGTVWQTNIAVRPGRHNGNGERTTIGFSPSCTTAARALEMVWY
jgi:hypothetical protein